MGSPTRHLLVDRDTRSLPGMGEEATATFSPDRRYRYALTRRWRNDRQLAAFIMLNPSTADAFVADPTIRRCVDFARARGAGGLLVVNLFALRSTDPKALYTDPDPVGPDNDLVISQHFPLDGPDIGPVVCAWGTHGAFQDRGKQVAELLRARGVTPLCLGTTKHGHPRHPLYVRGDTPTVEYADAHNDTDQEAAQRRVVLRKYARLFPSGNPIFCTPSYAEHADGARRTTPGNDGKAIYDSREIAEDAAREFEQLGADPLMSYRCGRHRRGREGHYHLKRDKTAARGGGRHA